MYGFIWLRIELSFQEDLGACAPRVSGIELESLITSVKDLLPDLGEGFIEVSFYSSIQIVNTD